MRIWTTTSTTTTTRCGAKRNRNVIWYCSVYNYIYSSSSSERWFLCDEDIVLCYSSWSSHQVYCQQQSDKQDFSRQTVLSSLDVKFTQDTHWSYIYIYIHWFHSWILPGRCAKPRKPLLISFKMLGASISIFQTWFWGLHTDGRPLCAPKSIEIIIKCNQFTSIGVRVLHIFFAFPEFQCSLS